MVEMVTACRRFVAGVRQVARHRHRRQAGPRQIRTRHQRSQPRTCRCVVLSAVRRTHTGRRTCSRYVCRQIGNIDCDLCRIIDCLSLIV